MKREYTVLISSHILSDLADMCSNIGVIHQGKMVLEGPIDEIMTSIDSSNPILIEVYQNLETARSPAEPAPTGIQNSNR